MDSFTDCWQLAYPGQVLVGACMNDSCRLADIYATLTFPPADIHPDEVLRQAILQMNCVQSHGGCDAVHICVDSSACQRVDGPGVYQWDVTNEISSHPTAEITLCAYAGQARNSCSSKEFAVCASDEQPFLILSLDNTAGNPHDPMVNIDQVCTAGATPCSTDWIDCAACQQCYYFVQNMGTAAVEVSVEISPGWGMSVPDSGPCLISPGETKYIIPLQPSRFARLNYQSTDGSANLLRIWLQGCRRSE